MKKSCHEKHNPADIKQAIVDAHGIDTQAAILLSERTGQKCVSSTIAAYVKRHPELQVAKAAAIAATLDFAETKLIQHITEGNLTAIIFYLKCKGKDRGYSERAQVDIRTPDGLQLKFPKKTEEDCINVLTNLSLNYATETVMSIAGRDGQKQLTNQ